MKSFCCFANSYRSAALALMVPLLLLIGATPARAKTWLVEMKKPLEPAALAALKKSWQGEVQLFDSNSRPYFQRLYKVDTEKGADLLRAHPLVRDIESVDPVELMGVEPAGIASKMSDDPLLPYQWAVENNGQVLTYDIDDITTGRRASVPHASVDLESLKGLDALMKRDALVAVIDSGVDVDHPDIKASIFRNTPECLNGETPLRPKEDHDKNEYLGDCKGWDFTGKEKTGTHRVIDDVGHGTHIAGILAAQINNDLGIAGISSRIKILPVRVFSKSEERKNGIGLTDRIAKGILYAVKMKADVLNLSFGWPVAMDKKHLREALKAAVDANIVIVAAAGNNNHSASMLPCAIEGVLCVGAINNRFEPTDFTNDGLHVDVLAPGDNILSLYPMAMTPDLFASMAGYDLMSGTSQAAPYVAALAAVLRGAEPELSAQQISDRIRLSSRPMENPTKKFLSGVISFKNALAGKTAARLLPDFKERDRVIFTLGQGASYRVRVTNPSTLPLTAVVRMESLAPHVQGLATQSITLGPGESTEVALPLQILDAKKSSDIDLKIHIGDDSYTQHVILTRDLNQDRSIKRLAVPALNKTSLYSILSVQQALDSPRYYTLRVEETLTTLTVLKPSETALEPIGSVQIKDLSRLASFTLLDLDHDGDLDYEIIAMVGKEKEMKLRHFRYDENLKPMTNAADLELQVEGVVQANTQLFYLYRQYKGQKFAMPFFFAAGPTPKKDQPKDPFAPRIEAKGYHLYYFTPEEVAAKDAGAPATHQLLTRIVDTNDRLKDWKKKLNLVPFSDVKILFALAQTEADLASNHGRLVVSWGYGFNRSYSIVTVSATDNGDLTFAWQPLDSAGRTIDGFRVDTGIDLRTYSRKGATLVGRQKTTLWEKISIDERGQSSELSRLESPDPTEVLNLYIKGFTDGDTRYSFLQAISQTLFTIERGSQVQTFTRPFHVSSFLPGQLFLERGLALWYQTPAKPLPALYIDASQIVARHAYLIVGSDEGLSVPIDMNINIPDKCTPLNPSLWNKDLYQFTLLCDVEGQWELRLVPMRYQ